MSSEDHVPKWTLAWVEKAAVEIDPVTHEPVLVVSGTLSSSGFRSEETRLRPHEEYPVRPEYWEIMVERDEVDAIFQSIVPFTLSMPLARFVGTKGVKVVCENKSVDIDVP
jgi:hypothetical protein